MNDTTADRITGYYYACGRNDVSVRYVDPSDFAEYYVGLRASAGWSPSVQGAFDLFVSEA